MIRRLKDKLGTRSVPTGEVEFNDALGYALRPRSGETGVQSDSDAGGLNRMMEMVNGSRLGVAIMGLGIARRAFLEAAIWVHHREANGRLLVDLPLMRERLVDLLVELEAGIALGFEAAAGQDEDGIRLRRIIIPGAKVRLCRLGVEAASQCIEVVGGNGYNEDWGLTRLLRDAQCLPIWEGSENVCALDVLRAIRRDQAHEAALSRIDCALDRARSDGPPFLQPEIEAIRQSRNELAMRIDNVDSVNVDRTHAVALRLTDLFNQTLAAALLAERGTASARKALVAARFVRRRLRPEAGWDDQIAARAGRDMLAYAEIEAGDAARAAM
ncbi:MAG: hypothetical protein GY708_09425 [Actinomycetia bacterium]|nr:hypothetical protein [Actinomycetes bacterium]